MNKKEKSEPSPSIHPFLLSDGGCIWTTVHEEKPLFFVLGAYPFLCPSFLPSFFFFFFWRGYFYRYPSLAWETNCLDSRVVILQACTTIPSLIDFYRSSVQPGLLLLFFGKQSICFYSRIFKGYHFATITKVSSKKES